MQRDPRTKAEEPSVSKSCLCFYLSLSSQLPHLKQPDSGASEQTVVELLIVLGLVKWSKVGPSLSDSVCQSWLIVVIARSPNFFPEVRCPSGRSLGSLLWATVQALHENILGFLMESWLACLCSTNSARYIVFPTQQTPHALSLFPSEQSQSFFLDPVLGFRYFVCLFLLLWWDTGQKQL